jgi:hypothetical protein
VTKFVYATLIALALAAGASTAPTLAAPPYDCPWIQELCEDDEEARKVNEYEGQHLAKRGSFDITEERLASQDDDTNSDVYKKGSFDIADAGDPSQWG